MSNFNEPIAFVQLNKTRSASITGRNGADEELAIDAFIDLDLCRMVHKKYLPNVNSMLIIYGTKEM